MNIVKEKDFYERQSEFVNKHRICNIITTSMTDNSYMKHYISEDGAEMYESNRIVTEKIEVKVKGIDTIAEVKLWETECWSTEFASMYMYQLA